MAVIEPCIPIKDNISQVTLEKLRFTLRKAIPNHYPTEINLINQDFTKAIYLELRQDIWAEKLQDTKKQVMFEFSYPVSWWQHFKQDCFPQWLLEKFPVKLNIEKKVRVIRFKRLAAFPDFRHAARKGNEHFAMHEYLEEVF